MVPILSEHFFANIFIGKRDNRDFINIDVVLLHAFPVTNALFTTFFPEPEQFQSMIDFPEDKCNFRFIFPDLPGFGTSPTLPNPPLDLNRYVEMIFQLTHHFQSEILLLGGCSMGGYIALEFLRKHAALVKGLILIDSKTMADSKEVKENRLENVAMIQTALNELENLKNNGVKNNSNWMIILKDVIDQNSLIKKWYETLVNNLLAENIWMEFPVRAMALQDLILKQNPKAIMDALLAMAGRMDTHNVLQSYLTPLSPHTHYSDKFAIKSNPVLIIAGEKDKLTPISLWKEQLDPCQHPNLTIQSIPNAAHLPPIEQPEEFYRVLLHWIYDIIKIL
jgi:pimeloyl-ACP methyl ester carboxylesterase